MRISGMELSSVTLKVIVYLYSIEQDDIFFVISALGVKMWYRY